MRWPPLPSDGRPGPDPTGPPGVERDGYGLSRRHFLAALAVPVVAGATGCGGHGPLPASVPYDPAQFAIPTRSPMGLFPAADYAVDFADLVTRGFKELGINVAGKRV